MKVMTVVGTRPEIIRLSRVMAVLDKYTDHILVHTGQNYDHELNQVFFDDLQIRKPDHFLEAAGKKVFLLGIIPSDLEFGSGLTPEVKRAAASLRDIIGRAVSAPSS